MAGKRPSLREAHKEIAGAGPVASVDEVFGRVESLEARTPDGLEAIKPQGPEALKPSSPQAPKEPQVSPTIHITKDTLWLLRRVATVRSHVEGKRPSISKVIESLVEANRDALEAEAAAILGGPKGKTA